MYSLRNVLFHRFHVYNYIMQYILAFLWVLFHGELWKALLWILKSKGLGFVWLSQLDWCWPSIYLTKRNKTFYNVYLLIYIDPLVLHVRKGQLRKGQLRKGQLRKGQLLYHAKHLYGPLLHTERVNYSTMLNICIDPYCTQKGSTILPC